MGLRRAPSFADRAALLCLFLSLFLAPDGRAQHTESFEYDALGRLSKAENLTNGTEVEYGYDAAGNRTRVLTNGGAVAEFTIDDVSVSEGGSAVFTVTRTGVTNESHSVSYATANSSATAGSDYVARSGTLTFSTGQTSRTVSVTTSNDSVHEIGESFFVNLSNPTNGAVVTDAQGSAAITDNDPAPAFSIANVAVSEGGNLVFTVTKSGLSSLSHNVAYASANGSARGGDYTARSGTLSFSPAQATRTVSVSTTEDAVYETNETLYMNLSNATGGATISDSQAVGTINDDDPAPAFLITNVAVSEGGNLVFTVTKSGLTSRTHNVAYASANGSAGGGDYTARSGTLSFSKTQTTRTVSVPTTEDAVYETNETLYLNLSGATGGATISDNQGRGTINNDDSAPSFSINDAGRGESQGPMVFTVTKTGATALSHSVSYATVPNSASIGDYSPRSGTLSFSAGQTSKTISVPITLDVLQEGTERFYVNLSSPTNSATISDSQGVGTIFDDDNGCELFCE